MIKVLQSRKFSFYLKTISINLAILMINRSLLYSLSYPASSITLFFASFFLFGITSYGEETKKKKLCFGYRASINLTTDHALPTKDIDFPTFKFLPVPCVASHDNSRIDRYAFGPFIDHVFFNGKISRIPLIGSMYRYKN